MTYIYYFRLLVRIFLLNESQCLWCVVNSCDLTLNHGLVKLLANGFASLKIIFLRNRFPNDFFPSESANPRFPYSKFLTVNPYDE